MKYDFKKVTNRKNTDCSKWDNMAEGCSDTIAAWVADMDFKAPPQVIAAIKKRASHGVFGYTEMNDDQYAAIMNWVKTRHGYDIQREWIIQSAGVICTLNAAMDELLKDGGSAVILSPCYPPFFDAADNMKHNKMVCELSYNGNQYKMDIEKIEECFKKGAKCLIICNPHNPVGRTWTYEELDEVGRLCEKYNITVISDDIHCDLILPGNKYVPALTVDSLKDRTIMLISATKTFNIAGLQTSSAIIPNDALRAVIYQRLMRYGHPEPNIFGIIAQQAAYENGADWVDELMATVNKNMNIILTALEGTKLKAYKPQATYLMWIDCRALGKTEEELKDFFVNECGICPTWGKPFGDVNYIRLNLAAPEKTILQIAERLSKALAKNR